MIDRIFDYSGKLRILRQIMSNKARSYGQINTSVKIGTVIVSSFITFVGFAGVDKITSYVSWFKPLTKDQVEFGFNLGVLALFVLIILHLVFRFSEQEAESSRAIISLTHLINEVDDLVLRAERGYQITSADVNLIRQKYDMLIQVLPSNNDSEYLRAKRDFRVKQTKKLSLQISAHEVFKAETHKRVVEALMRSSSTIMQALETIRQVDKRLYLAGGIIRNAVWDYLHGYSTSTQPDDVDVLYFDMNANLKVNDEALELKLQSIAPNVRWSVKNQARMHTINNETPFITLEDAITKCPETATAIAARLADDGTIEIIAPFGFDDLFRLIVQPTTHFLTKLEIYRKRLNSKKWEANWPKLKFFYRQ